MKKGVSLFALVTIIIIVILLLSWTVLNISNNDPIQLFSGVIFRNNVKQIAKQWDLYLMSKLADSSGNLDIDKVNLSSTQLSKVVNSNLKDSAKEFEVKNGKLLYIGKDITQIKTLQKIGIPIANR